MDKRFAEIGIEEIEGKSVFVATDETVDRDGDVISIDGWDLNNFKKNPVLLWSHNPFEPMIGRAKNIRMRNVNGGRKLTFEPEFHEKSPLSKLIADLVKQGWIKTVSVGFRAFEKQGNRFTKQELLEISFVNIPANPAATELAYAKGYNQETVSKLFNIPTEDIEKDEDKGNALGWQKSAVALRSVQWNLSENIALADIDDLKKMSAWADKSKQEVKFSYKLIHHKASEGYPVVYDGVVEAMATLLGAKGGVDMPYEDKLNVYNHLAKHYAEFNEEPPAFKEYTEKELKSIFPTQYPVTLFDIKELNQEVTLLSKALSHATKPVESQHGGAAGGRQVNIKSKKDRLRSLVLTANKALDIALSEIKKENSR